jgi:hypothetical protein
MATEPAGASRRTVAMTDWLGRWVRRSGLALLIAIAASVGLWRGHVTRAQTPAANFAYVTYLPGWNLISFAEGGDYSGDVFQTHTGNTLYTFRPSDTNYEVTTPAKTEAGFGYWVNVSERFNIVLDISARDSTTVNVSAGQCVIVGNPSTSGSARIKGADRSYVWSAARNQYVAETLVGVGRAAWVCEDSRAGTVSVAYEGDVLKADWPACCQIGATGGTPNRGQGLLVFHNDSPQPTIEGLRQIDVQGEPVTNGDVISGALGACASCPAYAPGTHGPCADAAPTVSASMQPGYYTLHIQSESENQADMIFELQVTPDTKYDLCYFITAGR